MKARFKAITASLAFVAVAAQAGELGPGNVNGLLPAATHGVVVPPADAIPVALREAHPLRGASVDVRFVQPVIRLARAEDSHPARDPGLGKWPMLFAGFLGAAAIARRRMSS